MIILSDNETTLLTCHCQVISLLRWKPTPTLVLLVSLKVVAISHPNATIWVGTWNMVALE